MTKLRPREIMRVATDGTADVVGLRLVHTSPGPEVSMARTPVPKQACFSHFLGNCCERLVLPSVAGCARGLLPLSSGPCDPDVYLLVLFVFLWWWWGVGFVCLFI